jgi:hypothetical protein
MARYVHQTENQLIFDKVRSIKLECDLLYSYLRYDGSADQEAAILKDISISLFDDVYMGLRSHWSAGTGEDGKYLPPDK